MVSNIRSEEALEEEKGWILYSFLPRILHLQSLYKKNNFFVCFYFQKESAFLSDLRKKIIPYLTRIEKIHDTDYRSHLVLNYFKQLSVDSINYIYLLVKHFPWTLLCSDANELAHLVIESVFACRNNELDQYEKINETLTLVNNMQVSVNMLSRLKHLDSVLACKLFISESELKVIKGI